LEAILAILRNNWKGRSLAQLNNKYKLGVLKIQLSTWGRFEWMLFNMLALELSEGSIRKRCVFLKSEIQCLPLFHIGGGKFGASSLVLTMFLKKEEFPHPNWSHNFAGVVFSKL
jgi:hypothetical protein